MRFETRQLDDLRLRDASAPVGATFVNPRTNSGLAPSDIRELAVDIWTHGVLVPLIITPDNLIIAGSRRFRALCLLLRWRVDGDLFAALATPAPSAARGDEIDGGIALLCHHVPVAVTLADNDFELEGIALADNLHRAELSGFEIAERLVMLSERGLTGLEISKLIGKSTSYVSRKLSTYRSAGLALLAAWRSGELADDVVQQLSELPREQQNKALAGPVPRGRRGPAHRPSVDSVRDFLFDLERKEFPPGQQIAVGREMRDFAYVSGVLDALRWVTGNKASPEFVKLAATEDDS